jgi:nucleotide-binding universal stress UspA family protein
LLDAEEASHRRALDELLNESGLEHLPWNVHLVKGPADHVVQAVVDRSRINLLVMGTVARTGIRGVVIGNTAEQILETVPCSVIAVKPPGFVSPLDRRRA